MQARSNQVSQQCRLQQLPVGPVSQAQMRGFTALLALPAGLLTLLATSAVSAQDLQWPYNLPRTARYFPEDEARIGRNLDVQKQLAWEAPAGVKKMSGDEGEKFYLDYWSFGRSPEDDLSGQGNSTSEGHALRPAIARHTDHDRRNTRLLGRSNFERSFKCPAGTDSCSSIGHAGFCCESDETCVSTSSGVGCCPSGSTCGDGVGGCDTGGGYTSCHGGCCIPGASCEGGGCVFYGTETVTLTESVATRTTVASSTAVTTSGRTVTLAYPTTETVTSGYTTTKTVVAPSSSFICTSGFFSCPVKLGGGCCQNGQACVSDAHCRDVPSITSTTTVTPGAPIRPTSQSISDASVQTTTAVAGCPTGFYMCSAVYLGGCCRVGRNCQTTSCPSEDSTTLISSGRTIYVTGGSGVTTAGGQGSCAVGWSSCAAAQNGGCCPSGYQCGAASCIATNPGQKNTGKEAPSSASLVNWAWSFVLLGIFAAAGMIWL